MKKHEKGSPSSTVEEKAHPKVHRRSFLGAAAGLGAAGFLLPRGAAAQQQKPPKRSRDGGGVVNSVSGGLKGPETTAERRTHAFQVRRDAAAQNRALPLVVHRNNGDEVLYPDLRGTYSKSLPHNAIGEVDLAAYATYCDALDSGDPVDFEAITLGNPGGGGPPPGVTPVHRLINPQAGLAFEMEGRDSHSVLQPPAPAFASAEQAGEIVENYWMAHLRDVPFRLYSSDATAALAIADLNTMSDFRGPRQGGLVTAQTLFRDVFPGCTVGPYLSQFFYLPQPFGSQDIDPRSNTAAPGIDYLTNQADWLARQNGVNPPAGDILAGLVYMRNGRDIGRWVHIDVLFQGYFQAFLTLASLGVPPNAGNPYNTSATQVGFGTLGGPYFAAMVCEVATRALKAVWLQKWFVHRRLRPEVFGGRIHVHITGQKPGGYDIHPDALNSNGVATAFSNHGTYFVPMAFPEGSPAHPAYGAGHATVAGACVTILKAFFDTEQLATNFFTPLEPTDDGAALVPYGGGDVGQMTIAGELNKIASNVATGRNIAGVHWRTDGVESILLGEKIAISILRDHKLCFNESFPGYTFRRFSGDLITV